LRDGPLFVARTIGLAVGPYVVGLMPRPKMTMRTS